MSTPLSIAAHIKRRPVGRNHQHSIVVVVEGARPIGGGVTLKETATAGHVERRGGVGEIVAVQLQELTGKETRAVGNFLLGLEAFDAEFPGFGHHTHGVEVKTDEKGRPYYALYCLRE